MGRTGDTRRWPRLHDGSHPVSKVSASAAATAINVLSGLIGNVAQSVNARPPDFLRVMDDGGGGVILTQQHSLTPPAPLKLGPLTGEAWIDGCNAWTAAYAVKDVFTNSDTQLVAFPQAKDVRCFITGVSGEWSTTRSNAAVQPFAEIYTGPGKDTRLRVSPVNSELRVGAWASCVKLK